MAPSEAQAVLVDHLAGQAILLVRVVLEVAEEEEGLAAAQSMMTLRQKMQSRLNTLFGVFYLRFVFMSLKSFCAVANFWFNSETLSLSWPTSVFRLNIWLFFSTSC